MTSLVELRRTLFYAAICCLVVVAYLWQGLDDPHQAHGAVFLAMPPGLPAIVPSASSSDPSAPAITARDAKAYVTAHPPEPSVINTSVSSVAFLTAREIETRQRITLGGDPNQNICVVTLNGLFTVVVLGLPGSIITTQQMRVYFDAHTGNQLAEAFQ